MQYLCTSYMRGSIVPCHNQVAINADSFEEAEDCSRSMVFRFCENHNLEMSEFNIERNSDREFNVRFNAFMKENQNV